jgi:hypothetical protein
VVPILIQRDSVHLVAETESEHVKLQVDIAICFNGPETIASHERCLDGHILTLNFKRERSAAGVTHRTEQTMESAFP